MVLNYFLPHEYELRKYHYIWQLLYKVQQFLLSLHNFPANITDQWINQWHLPSYLLQQYASFLLILVELVSDYRNPSPKYVQSRAQHRKQHFPKLTVRSEERRVGKEGRGGRRTSHEKSKKDAPKQH